MYELKILRGTGAEKSHWEVFESPLEGDTSVARALEELNEREELCTKDGVKTTPILWDCACLEKKCGACAMVIGGTPRLACAVRLQEAADRRGRITLKPLSKFERVADLRVDRQPLFDRLQEMHIWLENEADLSEAERRSLHYKASSCLMCGLCLEACPNFSRKNDFGGALATLASFRAIDQSEEGAHREALQKAYRKSVYEGCSKTLACAAVCPMELPIEELLVKTNAAAVWKRNKKQRKGKRLDAE